MLFLYNFTREVRSNGVRASFSVVHIRKFFKMYHNIARFRFFHRIAKRSIDDLLNDSKYYIRPSSYSEKESQSNDTSLHL